MTTPIWDQAPARVYWELTRACPLVCRHCRAEASRERAAGELTTGECRGVLARLAAEGPPAPHVIFTGGDPLTRPDLLELVRTGTGLGLGVSVAPSATPALSREVVAELKAAGVSAMSVSLDGATAARHDALRGVPGCFDWTLVAARRIVAAGIPLQINTLVTADTAPDLPETAKVVAKLGAARWSLFFLVSVGRGRVLAPLGALDCERTLHWLARHAPTWPFTSSTTEAPFYRRVLLQQASASRSSGSDDHPAVSRHSFGIRDGNGIMFIGWNGDVTPSGFLPVTAGNVRDTDPLEIYRKAPLFVALRTPTALRGRCGVCEFRAICGGSRARAWATSGDPLGEDPLCAWQPRTATAAPPRGG